MSYVELIVVLSIFSILSAVAIYNYGDFQANVDIKNLASDIALQIVTAQKSALNGASPSSGVFCDTCKPSYGVYFNTSTANDSDGKPFNTKFVYFADLNNAYGYDSEDSESIISITKGNYIVSINKCADTPCDLNNNIINSLSIFFKRPDSKAIFSDTSITGSDYAQITIKSPKENTSFIKVYPSGRIQVN